MNYKVKVGVLGIIALLFALVLPELNSSSAQGTLQKATVLEVRDGDTIRVEFEDGRGEWVRYAGIDAPELENCSGTEAREANGKLVNHVNHKEIWLEKNPQDGDYERDRDGRILAYVWLEAEKLNLAQVRLVQSGAVRFNPGQYIKDDVDLPFFPVRYAQQIMAAQIAAAQQRAGWWGECDPYHGSDLATAAIKYWGDEEIVYIVNRGAKPIDLGQGWVLRDSTESDRNRLQFSTITGPTCLLPAGGLLRVHSGPGISEEQRKTHTRCNEMEIDLYWTGYKIWGNKGDRARLFNPEGALMHEYIYPPHLAYE